MRSEYTINHSPQNELYRYQALLDLADLMVRHYSLSELFHEIAVRLQKVAEFQLLHFGLHDPKENVMRRHLWEGEGPVIPEAVSLADSASGYVWQNQTSLLIRDLREDQRFPQVFGPLREKGFRTYYVFPLTTAQSRLSALGVGSRKADAYGQQDLELLIRVAELVAIAVETALTKDALLEGAPPAAGAGECEPGTGVEPGDAAVTATDFRVRDTRGTARFCRRNALRRRRSRDESLRAFS